MESDKETKAADSAEAAALEEEEAALSDQDGQGPDGPDLHVILAEEEQAQDHDGQECGNGWSAFGRIAVVVWIGGGIGLLAILAGILIWYSSKVGPTVPDRFN